MSDNSFKLIHLKKSLGIKKLGKTEKKVLVALLEQREHSVPGTYYYPEGNNYIGLAEFVYGITEPVLYDLSLTHSTYSTLSSVLHRLHKKGLVKISTPDYQRRSESFLSSIDESTGIKKYRKFTHSYLVGLNIDEWSGGDGGYLHLEGSKRPPRGGSPLIPILPERTHKWWMLTENGREIAELLKELT